MKWRIYLLILFLIVPLQTTAVHYFSFHGINPDLALIAVCLIGFKMGALDGLMMGTLTGFLLDFFSGGGVPVNLLTKPIAGWVSGLIGKTVLDLKLISSMAVLAAISLVSGLLVYFFIQLVLGGIDSLEAFRWIIFPQAVYDGIAGALLLALVPNRGGPNKGWE